MRASFNVAHVVFLIQHKLIKVIFHFFFFKCKFVDGDIGRCIASLKIGKFFRFSYFLHNWVVFNLVFVKSTFHVIEEEHTNRGGGLHGGLSALLVDCISTIALVHPEEPLKLGVSVNMDLTYMKGAKVGDDVLIDAKLLRKGRNLAFLEVELKNKNTNDVLVKGSHTKFIGSS